VIPQQETLPAAASAHIALVATIPLVFFHINFNVNTIPETMEDFNLPSSERIVLLNSLQEAIGDVPPYFWASCQVCDLKALGKLVELARISPAMVRIFAAQTRVLVLHCIWKA
jgi:hypothetical protein